MFLLLGLLAACGLGDSAVVECRCTPGTNLALFPGCPRFAVIQVGGTDYWIADGDTIDPETDWFTGQGERKHGTSSNPFATQVPDCPTGQQLPLHEPTRPDLVLFNVRIIFQAPPENRNLDQYMDQLAPNFSFVPDEQDIQLHPEVYDVRRDTLWGRDQERSFAQAILDPDRMEAIRFTRWYESSKDERIPSEDQLHETFIFPYEGEFIEKTQEEATPSVLSIKGWMEIDLITPTAENPVWTIEQWRDRRDPATAKRSWGELRAEFAR